MRLAARRAVAARGGLRSRTPDDRAPIRAGHHGRFSWRGSRMLFVPRLWVPGFLAFAALELAVPVWAERAAPTTWHPHHIAERYGLLTLIVLGESILAATVAVQAALASGEALSALVPLIVGGLLIVYSMWWVYFDRPVHDLLTSLRKAIVWGYGHYLVFAAAAAVGAGLAVSVDQVDASRQDRRGRRRRRRRDSRRRLPAVPLVSSRPAGVSPDAAAGPDRRGPRAAHAVHRSRRAADRRDPGQRWSRSSSSSGGAGGKRLTRASMIDVRSSASPVGTLGGAAVHARLDEDVSNFPRRVHRGVCHRGPAVALDQDGRDQHVTRVRSLHDSVWTMRSGRTISR